MGEFLNRAQMKREMDKAGKAINEFIEGLKEKAGEALISVIPFGSFA